MMRACSAQVDTELVYAYAKTEDMGALEEFMSGQHQANLQSVGDRVFDEGLYDAARAIFAHIPNWGRLASTLVRLHQFQQAVDAARKANSPRTWKEVRLPACPAHDYCRHAQPYPARPLCACTPLPCTALLGDTCA